MEETETYQAVRAWYTSLIAQMKEYVIGSDALVEALALAVVSSEGVRNVSDDGSRDSFPRQCLLLIGGTGSGKSYTVRTAAKCAGKPLIRLDMSSVSATGYEGASIEDILGAAARNSSMEEFKRSIIFFDEIDKAVLSEPAERRFDVMNELLVLVEDSQMQIRLSRDTRVKTDARNTLLIFAGAFDGLEEIIAKRLGRHRLGFAPGEAILPRKESKDILSRVTAEDLVEYGLSPQFLGRISRILVTKPLGRDDYLRILTDSKDSPLKKQETLLREVYGMQLIVEKDALAATAEQCVRCGTGARGLESLLCKPIEAGLAHALKFGSKELLLTMDGDNLFCRPMHTEACDHPAWKIASERGRTNYEHFYKEA